MPLILSPSRSLSGLTSLSPTGGGSAIQRDFSLSSLYRPSEPTGTAPLGALGVIAHEYDSEDDEAGFVSAEEASEMGTPDSRPLEARAQRERTSLLATSSPVRFEPLDNAPHDQQSPDSPDCAIVLEPQMAAEHSEPSSSAPETRERPLSHPHGMAAIDACKAGIKSPPLVADDVAYEAALRVELKAAQAIKDTQECPDPSCLSPQAATQDSAGGEPPIAALRTVHAADRTQGSRKICDLESSLMGGHGANAQDTGPQGDHDDPEARQSEMPKDVRQASSADLLQLGLAEPARFVAEGTESTRLSPCSSPCVLAAGDVSIVAARVSQYEQLASASRSWEGWSGRRGSAGASPEQELSPGETVPSKCVEDCGSNTARYGLQCTPEGMDACALGSSMAVLLERFDEAREPQRSFSAPIKAFMQGGQCPQEGGDAAKPSPTPGHVDDETRRVDDDGALRASTPLPDSAARVSGLEYVTSATPLKPSRIPSPSLALSATASKRIICLVPTPSKIPVHRNSTLLTPSASSARLATPRITTPSFATTPERGPISCPRTPLSREESAERAASVSQMELHTPCPTRMRSACELTTPVATAQSPIPDDRAATYALPTAVVNDDLLTPPCQSRDYGRALAESEPRHHIQPVESFVDEDHVRTLATDSSKTWLSPIVAPLPLADACPRITPRAAIAASTRCNSEGCSDGIGSSEFKGSKQSTDMLTVASTTIASEWLLSASEVPFLSPLAGGTSALQREADVAAWLKETPAASQIDELRRRTSSLFHVQADPELPSVMKRTSSDDVLRWLEATATDPEVLADAFVGVRGNQSGSATDSAPNAGVHLRSEPEGPSPAMTEAPAEDGARSTCRGEPAPSSPAKEIATNSGNVADASFSINAGADSMLSQSVGTPDLKNVTLDAKSGQTSVAADVSDTFTPTSPVLTPRPATLDASLTGKDAVYDHLASFLRTPSGDVDPLQEIPASPVIRSVVAREPATPVAAGIEGSEEFEGHGIDSGLPLDRVAQLGAFLQTPAVPDSERKAHRVQRWLAATPAVLSVAPTPSTIEVPNGMENLNYSAIPSASTIKSPLSTRSTHMPPSPNAANVAANTRESAPPFMKAKPGPNVKRSKSDESNSARDKSASALMPPPPPRAIQSTTRRSLRLQSAGIGMR